MDILDPVLDRALQNEDNDDVVDTSLAEIAQDRNDALQQLGYERADLRVLNKRLANYMVVGSADLLRYGSYVRWVPWDGGDITTGGIVCRLSVGDTGLVVTCRNRTGRLFSFVFGDSCVFQKLTNQQLVILRALAKLRAAT